MPSHVTHYEKETVEMAVRATLNEHASIFGALCPLIESGITEKA